MAMSGEPMPWIPQKKTIAMDWVRPMKTQIKQSHNAAEADKLGEHFERMNRLRESLRLLGEGRQPMTESQINQILTPYAALVQFANMHFPLTDGRIKNLTFTWIDCVCRKKVSLPNVNIEYACVFFAIGALQSSIAATEEKATNEGVKSAYKRYQKAAGYFAKVKEILSTLTERTTTDLSPEYLNMLVHFMLTCAQHCFYLSCSNEMKGKNMLLAKLAMESSAMYEDLHRMLLLPSISESVDRNWISVSEFYRAVLEARAQTHVADEQLAQTEIGQQIGRLQRAAALLNEASSAAKLLKGEFLPFWDRVKKETDRKLAKALEENQQIYHERIPPFDQMEPLQRTNKPNAKVTPVGNVFEEAQMTDPFEHIVAAHILDALQTFKTGLNSDIDNHCRQARTERESIRENINRLGVMGMLGAGDSRPRLPANLRERVGKLQQEARESDGLTARIAENQTRLQGLADTAKNSCDRNIRDLEDEARGDETLRSQFGSRWAREPSNTVNTDLMEKLREYRQKLGLAAAGDKTVTEKVQHHFNAITRLDMPLDQLDSSLPSASSAESNPALKEALTQLAQLHHALEEKENVEQVYILELRDLQDREDRDLQAALAAAGSTGQEAVLREARKKFDEKMQYLLQTGFESKALLAQITELVNKINELKRQGQQAGDNAREKMINELDSACNAYTEIIGNMTEGIRFYDAMNDALEKISSRVDDFNFARRVQKDDLLDQIQRDAARAEVHSPAVPPHAARTNTPAAQPPQQPQQQPQYQPPPQHAPPAGGSSGYSAPGYAPPPQQGGYQQQAPPPSAPNYQQNAYQATQYAPPPQQQHGQTFAPSASGAPPGAYGAPPANAPGYGQQQQQPSYAPPAGYDPNAYGGYAPPPGYTPPQQPGPHFPQQQQHQYGGGYDYNQQQQQQYQHQPPPGGYQQQPPPGQPPYYGGGYQ